MKKNAKFLALGAISALSMGVFAIAKPAMADDLVPLDYDNAKTSADVTIRLTVTGEVPTVSIANPLDGEVILGRLFPISVDYTDSVYLDYDLTYIADDGTRVTYSLPRDIVSTEGTKTGNRAFSVNIDNYGGKFGDYILTAKASGAGTAVDSVQFRMISFDFSIKGIEEETYDPIITIPKNPDVYKALIQVFDEEGNAIYEEPIEQILEEGADTDVTLPLTKYGVPEGKYLIVATPYDEDGNIIDLNVERYFDYKSAPAPEVPDTGGFFGALNLSQQDMASTGLALLFICGFFGILLIAKRNKSDKRR